MTPRERLLAAYRRQTPDCVPALADLSWWHAGHGGGKFIPGATGNANRDKVRALIELHRQTGAAIHLNLGAFYSTSFADPVRVWAGIRGEQYVHRFETPVGVVEEVREWSDITFSWPIVKHMIESVEDLKVARYVFERVRYATAWEVYHEATQVVGDLGVPLVQAPYTGMGFLMSRYAGVEMTVMLAMDEPAELEATVATINAAHERVFRMLAQGPSEVLMVSDNLSSDTQSPPWFRQYSAAHYATMARIAHEHGKPFVTHIDGRLRGLIEATREAGVNGADAVTPAPAGDMTPAECRAEAGRDYVLSGGVPPSSFAASVPMALFDAQVEEWLELRRSSPALFIAPGDQLPPDGDLSRVKRMVEMANRARY